MRTGLLLRLLLCLSLVLNGVATALAGAATSAPHTMSMAHASATHASGCHDDGMTMHAMASHERAPPHGQQGGNDCCTDVTCLSHCLGTGFVAAPSLQLHSAPLASVALHAPALRSHRAPALSDALRPPIG